MDPATRRLIDGLHAAPFQYVLALTGGGTTAAAQLLAVPGGSRTVLEIVVPYHQNALDEFLGYRPAHYCSEATSVALAQRAWERADWLAPRGLVAGIGCTASLATDRPKRGDHHFYLAIRTGRLRATYALTLVKGDRDREGEEHVLTAILLNALAETFGVAERLPVPLLPGEAIKHATDSAPDRLAQFLNSDARSLCVASDGRLCSQAPRPAVLLPGSFNPLHDGHRRMAQMGSAAFELSVINVDKPPLTVEEIRHRLRQFAGRCPVWLTKTPTFVEKAELFPGVLFVVGVDTAERIIAPRYYQGSTERMLQALERLRTLGCRFLVAGRTGPEGRFIGADDLAIPPAYRALFSAVPEDEFRYDISSTQLRNLGG